MKGNVLIAAVAVAIACGAMGEPFKDGDRVVFLGDSITRAGNYMRYVTDYYYTRFPDRRIEFFNAGVSGDTSAGCGRRLGEDVNVHKPTVVSIMFGMNDCNKCLFLEPFDEKCERQLDVVGGRYFTNMVNLARRLKRDNPGVRLIWAKPSIFDETAAIPAQNRPNKNKRVLKRFAEIVDDVAKAEGGEVVDFTTPMTEFNALRQKGDPSYTMIGPDRVHPGQAGGFFMAMCYLRDTGCPAIVDTITLEGVGRPRKVAARALPLAIEPGCSNVTDHIDAREFSRELVVVKNLPPGRYRLLIDGKAVTNEAAEAFAAGVDVAGNIRNPDLVQAAGVISLNRKRVWIEQKHRMMCSVREFVRRECGGVTDDMAKVKALYDSLPQERKTRDFFAKQLPDYIEKWPARDSVAQELCELVSQIREAARPVARTYEIVPLK